MQKIETTEKMYPFLVAECDGKVIDFTYGSQLRPMTRINGCGDGHLSCSGHAPMLLHRISILSQDSGDVKGAGL